MEPVAYECDTGYALVADGDPIVFGIPRQADEQFSATTECSPMRCDKATPVDNAAYDAAKVGSFQRRHRTTAVWFQLGRNFWRRHLFQGDWQNKWRCRRRSAW